MTCSLIFAEIISYAKYWWIQFQPVTDMKDVLNDPYISVGQTDEPVVAVCGKKIFFSFS